MLRNGGSWLCSHLLCSHQLSFVRQVLPGPSYVSTWAAVRVLVGVGEKISGFEIGTACLALTSRGSLILGFNVFLMKIVYK